MKKLTDEYFEAIRRKIEELENKLNKLGETGLNINRMEISLTVKEIRQAERKRIAEIEAFAEKFTGEVPKLKEKSYNAIKNGISAKEFRHYIFLIRQSRLKP